MIHLSAITIVFFCFRDSHKSKLLYHNARKCRFNNICRKLGSWAGNIAAPPTSFTTAVSQSAQAAHNPSAPSPVTSVRLPSSNYFAIILSLIWPFSPTRAGNAFLSFYRLFGSSSLKCAPQLASERLISISPLLLLTLPNILQRSLIDWVFFSSWYLWLISKTPLNAHAFSFGWYAISLENNLKQTFNNVSLSNIISTHVNLDSFFIYNPPLFLANWNSNIACRILSNYV